MFGGELHMWDTDRQDYTQKQWFLVPLIMLSYQVLISQRHTYTLKFTYCKVLHFSETDEVKSKIWTSSETIHNDYKREKHN